MGLSYALLPSYSLSIQASDGTTRTAATISVNVTLLETSAIGDTLVCTIDTILTEVLEGIINIPIPLPTCFNSDGSTALVSQLTYTISSGNQNSIFEVSPGGFLSTRAPLDYEEQTVHILTLSVQNAEQPPRSSTLMAIVSVAPVNEYPPLFSSDLIQITLSEAVSVGTAIGMAEATDQDGGRDGTVTYSLLQPPLDLIAVHPDSGSIILTNTLDYESVQEHNFTISAVDGPLEATSRRSATATLSIVVRDANDNPPIFSRPLYSAEVREDSSAGHLVASLSCTDRDSGANAEVTYSISTGNDDMVFAVDVLMGVITLANTLDYDMPSNPRVFTLTVQCHENRAPHAVAESLLLIELTSFNEFYPDPGSPYMASIREDTSPGSQVLQVRGRDRDYGLAGVLRYFLNVNNEASCPDNLYLDERTGNLYLMSEFDYESDTTSYTCVVSVWDSERPIHISEQDISITVLNMNDAAPVCTPSVQSVEVTEDMPVGHMFLALSCSDPDSNNLQYSLVGDPITNFQLSQSGELSLREMLDAEIQTLHIFHAVVTDGEYSTNVTVYLTVTGTNEYTPVFTTLPDCSLPENSVLGTQVCALRATDGDYGADGLVNYEILTPNSIFEIEPDTGLVFAVGETDREIRSRYTLTVRATDGGLPSRASDVDITVDVTDENDNSPQIEHHVFASISENSPVGSLVTTIICTDADQENSSNSNIGIQITNLFQELASGGTLSVTTPLFTLSSTNGELRTAGQLDFESASLYHLSLVCRDQGSLSLATPSTVHVVINPINEYTPSFSQARYEVTVAENLAVGSNIANVSASDNDAQEHGNVRYSILSPTGTPFWVDPQNGAIHILRQLRCDLETRYRLIVAAQDGGTPSLESTVDVIINIDQCHLGELVPSSNIYTGSVVENAPVGTSVLRVECTNSRSLSIVHNPSYVLTQASDVFQLAGNSGEVTVRASPDYENSDSHLLHVRCLDPNHSEVFADTIVYISILPVNEHLPLFEQSSYRFQVLESMEPGSRVGTVRAADADIGRDGKVVYSVQDTSYILINHETGDMYLSGELDRESQDMVSLWVTASDSPTDASVVRSSIIEVTIVVQDYNDNWPVCERTVYYIHTSPQIQPPEVVFDDPECTDADIGSNSELVYSLGSGDASDKFSVDSATGELSLVDSLDPEDATTYRVPVVVRDNGDTPLSITLLVIVDLQQPLLEVPTGGGSEQEYLSLVEAEGKMNAVTLTLEDFSKIIVSLFLNQL